MRSAVLLRWSVTGGITGRSGGGSLGGIGGFGQAEIHQNRLPIRGDLHIGRLDIAVDDGRVLVVQVGDGGNKLARPIQDAIYRGNAFFLKNGLQIAAGDKIHHQILRIAHNKMIDHAWKVGMTQSCQKPGFAQKLLLTADL